MLHSVGVLAISSILRSARRLHVRGAPRLRAERAQECRRVRCAGPHLHVIRLEQRAALRAPIVLELENHLLNGEHRDDTGGLMNLSGLILRDRRVAAKPEFGYERACSRASSSAAAPRARAAMT